MVDQENKKPDMPEAKEYFQLGELLNYFFRKKDPDRKTNNSIRAMHWVNKISILVFLVAVIILIIRHVI